MKRRRITNDEDLCKPVKIRLLGTDLRQLDITTSRMVDKVFEVQRIPAADVKDSDVTFEKLQIRGADMIAEFARVLHGHLLSLTEIGGEANTIVDNTEGKNGIESWRRLAGRFYPITEAGATGLATEIQKLQDSSHAMGVINLPLQPRI